MYIHVYATLIVNVTVMLAAHIFPLTAYCSSVLFDKSTGILVFLRECATLDEVLLHFHVHHFFLAKMGEGKKEEN